MSNNGRYSQIYTKIWNDEKFRQLSPESQRLYLYVLTSPHSNMAGYYLLPKTYIERDMVTLPKGLDKPLGELLDKGLVRYDEGSSVILIPNYFRYNSLDNKNQKKGANTKAKELPDNNLVKDFKEICKKYYPDSFETLTKGLVEGSGNTENRKPKQKEETEVNVSDSKSEDDPLKYPQDSKPYQLAHKLRKLIRKNNEYTQLPDDSIEALQGWADSIRKMNEYGESANDDGKSFSYEEIDGLIEFSQDDDFWRQNILSASKLRKQAGKLMQRIKENGNKEKKKPITADREIVDYTPSERNRRTDNEK